ncbi:MAG TPA: M56 family metallopeptidase [Dongiaceae bacterium]|nr:M56 family metallopeptidase [Dongiaceae bacterium]
MKAEIFAAGDQLLTAALNGSCQGILLALLAGLGLRLLGPTNAATRHAAWFATLLLLALLIPAHYWRQRLAPNPPGPLNAPIASAPVPERAPSTITAASPEGGRPQNDVREREAFGLRELAPAFALVETAESLAHAPGDAPRELRPSGARNPAEPRRRDFGWALAVIPKIPTTASLVLLAAWVAVAGLKLTLLARGLYLLRRLKDSSTPASPGLEDLFQRLRSELSVNRAVRLRVSQSHQSALVLGFVHPVIVLPAEAAQESGVGQAEHILRHELTHVRRRDDWTNLAQRLLEAALFFHPAVWWISKQLSLEREIACDDAVLHQGVRPQPYALLLANVAGRMTGRLPSVAPGVSSSKSQLQQRITMILNTHRNTSPRLAKARLGCITSASALVAVLALYSGPRLVLAQTQSPTPAAAPPASGATSSLPPGDVDPGPKFKPGEAPATPAALPAVAPMPPEAPEPPEPADPPEPAVTVSPSSSPSGGVFAVTGPSADVFARTPPAPPQGGSIEERLARLERMVQKLLAEQGAKRGRAEAQTGAMGGMGGMSGPKHGRMDTQDLASAPKAGGLPLDLKLDLNLKGKDGKDWKFQFDNKDMERLQERVEHEVARATDQAMREVARADEQAVRATEQAKRAFEQAQRAAKQAAEQFRRDERNENKIENAREWDQGQNLKQQLATLQKHREFLDQEMQKLNREIQRLEEDRKPGQPGADARFPRNRKDPTQPKPETTPSDNLEKQ